MAFENISVRLAGEATGVVRAAALGSAAVTGYGGTVAKVAGQVTAASTAMRAGMLVALAGIGLGLRATIAPALEFEIQMRNVNSIVRASEGEFRLTSDAVLELSDRVPQAADDLAAGLYDIASSGFAGADGLRVLEAAAVAATAGITSTEVAARAIAGSLNAYGLAASAAGRVSDILFETVNVGVITFEQLANNLGDVIGLAAAAKVPLEDVGAAMAAMTLAAISPAEASTALARLLQAIIDPTEELLVVLREAGFESGALALEQIGLAGVMQLVRDATGGEVTALLTLFNEVRAAKGAFGLLSAEGENYRKTTAAISDENARAGATQNAFSEQMKATGNELKLVGNQLKGDAIRAGRALLPVVSDLAKALQGTAAAAGVVLGPFGDLAAIALANKEILQVLVVLLGVKLARAILTAGLDRLAPLMYDAAGGFDRFRASLTVANARMLAGRAAALGLQAGIVVLAHSVVTNLASARQAAAEFVGELETGIDKTTKGGLDELTAKLARARGELEDMPGAGASIGDAFRAVVLDALPFLDTGVSKTEAQRKALEELNEQISKLRANYAQNRNAIARDLELPTARVDELVKQLGIDLTDTFENSGPAREQAAAQIRRIADELGLTTSQLGKLDEKAREALETLKKLGQGIIGTFSAALDIVAGFDPTDPAEAAARAADAAERLADARRKVADIDEKIARNARFLSRTHDRDRELADLGRDRADALGDVADAEVRLGRAQDANLSREEQLRRFLKERAEEARRFLADVRKAAQMGLDPGIIQRALEQGPGRAGEFLSAITSEQGLVDLANETERIVQEAAARAGVFGQLASQALLAGKGEIRGALGEVMAVVDEAMRQGADATSRSVADALGMMPDRVEWLADPERYGHAIGLSLGVGIAQGLMDGRTEAEKAGEAASAAYVKGFLKSGHLDTIFDTISGGEDLGGVKTDNVRRIRVPTNRLHGGIDLQAQHGIVAHFARQPTVLYGERSTGGEAFIPLGAQHRARSLSIWAEAGRLMGQPVGMQRGGIIAGGDVAGRTVVHRYEFHVGRVETPDPKAFVRWAEQRARVSSLTGGD